MNIPVYDKSFYVPPSKPDGHTPSSSWTVMNDKNHWWKRALCLPHGYLTKFATRLAIAAVAWAMLFGIVHNDALPGGKLFALWLMVVGGLAAGWLVERVHLPALFGMLLWGFALRNVPGINFGAALDSPTNGGRVWASQLRNIALAIILLRAGLGLDTGAIRRLRWAIAVLAVMPAASVVVTLTMGGHWLMSLPLMWSLLLGLVCCAVSPAVIVPLMLMLQERRYGTRKGIPSAVIAACTICSVVVLCSFGLVLGLTFSTGSLAFNLLRAPLEVTIGCLYGTIVGVMLWYIPAATKTSTATCRTILLVGAGVAAVCCGKALNLTGAGVLGCLLTALVCASGWSKRHGDDDDNDDDFRTVSTALRCIWLYAFQPLLFGLIGSAVAVQQLDVETIANGLILVAVAHAVQLLITFAAVSMPCLRFGFTLRERIFLALTWLPKATIQAAIGSVALDTVREHNSMGSSMLRPPEEEQYARSILTIAVLSILVTAPLGAVAITVGGKYLLDKNDDDDDDQIKDEEVRLPMRNSTAANQVV